MWKKTAAVCLIAGFMALGAPMAANAEIEDDSVGYVAPAGVAVNPVTVDHCLSSTITFGARFWAAGAPVSIAVEGYHATDAKIPTTARAAADGSLATTFQPPSDGRSTYSIIFRSADREYVATVAVTGGADADRTCNDDPDVSGALASTGGSTAPWIAVAGAGMVLAGGAVLVARTQRKRS